MADWTKSESADAIAHRAVTHPSTVESSTINVSDADMIFLLLRWASIEATANTNSGKFLVQGSDKTAGDENWVTLLEVSTPVGTTTIGNLDSGGEAIGQKVIGVDATAGMAVEEWVYIHDTTTEGDSEWCLIMTVVTNDTIEIVDGLAVAKDDADDTCSDAQVTALAVDVHGFNRIRVLYIHEGATGANNAIWVSYSLATDFA